MIRYLAQTFRRMERTRVKYLVVTLSVFLTFAFVLATVFAYQFERLNSIHANNTREQIIEIKKDFLEDSVNNTIRYIREIRNINEDRFKSRIERIVVFIDEHAGTYGIDHVQDYLQSGGINEDIVIIIKDPEGKILFESPAAQKFTSTDNSNEDFFVSESIGYDGNTIFVGALDQTVKTLVEDSLRERLYNDLYFDDAYIWVNEVIDFEGGEGYGSRLIHPNLKDTEGMLLSTDMEDIAGGKPYLEELAGIRENGEVFFTYYFKKLTTDTIERKITFAKLCDDYNWIVAMGIYYDNLEEYIAKASASTGKERNLALSILGLMTVLLLLAGILLFVWAERIYYFKSTEPLKTAVETDLLTGAGSRRSGLRIMSDAFKEFKARGGIYNLFVIDLDDFKKVNDTYGHEVGDMVLVRVVDSIRSVIREDDRIFRWGGEEFVIFTKGIAVDNLDLFIDNVLKAVVNSKCSRSEMDIQITVSLGATCFIDSDESVDAALKRADDGLYESKRNGKNRGTIV